MQTATVAFKEVKIRAEQIRNDETQRIGTVSLGDCLRQGDLLIVSIGTLPKNIKLRKDRQLAPGATQGSRHVASDGCDLFDANTADVVAVIANATGKTVPVELIGPVFCTTAECEIAHPEHGNFVLPAGECFAVVYQRAFADNLRRQLD